MTWRSLVLKTVKILALSWLGLVLLAACFYPRLLYYPDRGPMTVTPKEAGAESYEDVWLTAADGIKINAWHVPGDATRKKPKTLLVFHGNAGNLSTAAPRIGLYHKRGYDVFMIDYHGFGKSGGEPGEDKLYLDADAAWSHLTRERNIPAKDIVVVGYSLGGAVASWLAEKHPDAAGLVLESTFTRLSDVAADFFPYLPCRLILGDAFNSLGRLPGLRMPLLVIHGQGDQLVAYKFGQELYAAYRGRKEFFRIADDHNIGFLLSGERYAAEIERFVDSLDTSF